MLAGIASGWLEADQCPVLRCRTPVHLSLVSGSYLIGVLQWMDQKDAETTSSQWRLIKSPNSCFVRSLSVFWCVELCCAETYFQDLPGCPPSLLTFFHASSFFVLSRYEYMCYHKALGVCKQLTDYYPLLRYGSKRHNVSVNDSADRLSLYSMKRSPHLSFSIFFIYIHSRLVIDFLCR